MSGYKPEDGDQVRSVIGHLFERAHFDAKALKELLLPAGRCASGEDDLVKQELLREGFVLRDGLIPAPRRAGAAVGKADNVVAGKDEVAVVCGGKEGLKGGAADVIDVLESFLVAKTSNMSYSLVGDVFVRRLPEDRVRGHPSEWVGPSGSGGSC